MRNAFQWIDIAKRDIHTANVLFDTGLYGPCAFHSQQAAEKSLKAVLVYKTGSFPKIHDLVRLAKLAAFPVEPVGF